MARLRQEIRGKFGDAVLQIYDANGESRLIEKELKSCIAIGSLNEIESACDANRIVQKQAEETSANKNDREESTR